MIDLTPVDLTAKCAEQVNEPHAQYRSKVCSFQHVIESVATIVCCPSLRNPARDEFSKRKCLGVTNAVLLN